MVLRRLSPLSDVMAAIEENYTDQLATIGQYRAPAVSARHGRVGTASRRDYATAAVAVLSPETGTREPPTTR